MTETRIPVFPLYSLILFAPCLFLSPVPSRAQEMELPRPGGPYPVGVTEYVEAGSPRPDSLIPGMENGRSVKVRLWYPAEPATVGAPIYLADLATRADALGADFAAAAARVRSHARAEARLSRRGAPFPVVLLSHSLGGLPGLYTGLAEELASRGYVVAAVGHPGGAAVLLLHGTLVTLSPAWDEHDPGRVGIDEAFAFRRARTRFWAEDVLSVLERLPAATVAGEPLGDRVDIRRAGYVGHSVGGSAAAVGCALSDSLDACVNLDGWPVAVDIRKKGLSQPYLHVEESRPYRSDSQLEAWGVDRARYDRIQARLDAGRDSLFQAMRGPSYHLVVDGLTHEGLSDVVLWNAGDRSAQALPPERGLAVLRSWLRWFLDRHVRNRSEARPPDPVRFPEVRFTAYGEEWSQDRPGSR